MRSELESGCKKSFEELLNAIPAGWIAGGAVRDYFARMDSKSDIDVFFSSRDNFRSSVELLIKLRGFRKLYDHDVIAAFRWKQKVVQLIGTHFFDSPQETIKSFDFTVCCCAVSKEGVVVHEHFLSDLAGRRLAINSLPFPLSTLERLQKYAARGFVACNGTLLEIAKAIKDVDFSDEQNTLAMYPDGTARFIRFD